MSELTEIKLPVDGKLQGFFGQTVYLKYEVDQLIKEKSDEIEKLNFYLSQIAEQKDKIINDLIKALQNNGPKFVELEGQLINLNNITAITHVVQMSDGYKLSGNISDIKSIIKSKYMEKLDDNGRNSR